MTGADLADVRDELRAVARGLLGGTDAREAVDWSLLSDVGWPGLEAPEELGGGGASFAEVAVVLEELGRAAARSPFLGSAVLGVGALGLLAAGPRRDDLLREVASGRTLVTVAVGDGGSDAAGPEPPFRLEAAGAARLLHGSAAFVPDASAAAVLLLPALDVDGSPLFVALDAGTAGIDVATQPVLDATRDLARVTADGADVPAAAVHHFAGEPWKALTRLHDRAALAVACDSLGVSGAMLDTTVAYVGTRHQFGRAVGSFQAVKHACADLLVHVTMARELVAAAVAQVAAGDPDAGVAVSMAKAYTCGAAVDVAGKAMQLHGGIGYTWESGIHVHLKRAALNRSLFGSPATHRRRVAARYG